MLCVLGTFLPRCDVSMVLLFSTSWQSRLLTRLVGHRAQGLFQGARESSECWNQ